VRERGLRAGDAVGAARAEAQGLLRPRLAKLTGIDSESRGRAQAPRAGVRPVYKRVDTCAAEFATPTAYMYSTYEAVRVRVRAEPTERKKIIILGGGPNRIGQGIEFDYCCVHAALRAARGRLRDHHGQLQSGDRVDRLRHLRPAVFRAADARGRARDRRRARRNALGVIVQFGGQTPLKLARALEAAGVPIIGTSPDDRLAEDRERFQQLLHEARPEAAAQRTRAPRSRRALAREIGYPLVVRPSYVLGGRAMEIVHDKDLERYMREAVKVSNDSPVLLDRFLDDAIEVDVDASATAPTC
jgi:carbamoyl-phosphate synthase large subunit